MIKRVVEIFFSLILLLVLFPILFFIGLAIKLDSPGPIIFKQKRVGRFGRGFMLFKFRTMFNDVDPLGISPRGNQDVRITRAGRFLRKYKLDELPQLFNIFMGDMSFVGPRPQLGKEIEVFQGTYPELLEKRLKQRPGITCSWAITPGKIKIKPTFEMLVEDCDYIDNQSLWLDFKIMIRTFLYIFKKDKEV